MKENVTLGSRNELRTRLCNTESHHSCSKQSEWIFFEQFLSSTTSGSGSIPL